MKKISYIVIAVFVSSIITGKILDNNYKKFWVNPFEKLDAIFKDSTNRDIVFIGDSRAHIGINPYYVDSITKLNTFNLGMGGASINEVFFLTEAWLKKHKPPKLFVYSIGYGSILRSNIAFKNPCYYLFYLNDKYVYNTFEDLNYHVLTYRLNPLFKYTAFDEYDKTSILRCLKGDRFLEPNGINYKGFINNGFAKVYKEENNSDSVINEKDNDLDKGLKKLNDLIFLIKANKSGVIFIYPPNINFQQHYKDSISKNVGIEVEKITLKNNIPIWHFEKDSSFTKALFQDPIHLNIKGSINLSKKIGLLVKKIVAQ